MTVATTVSMLGAYLQIITWKVMAGIIIHDDIRSSSPQLTIIDPPVPSPKTAMPKMGHYMSVVHDTMILATSIFQGLL